MGGGMRRTQAVLIQLRSCCRRHRTGLGGELGAHGHVGEQVAEDDVVGADAGDRLRQWQRQRVKMRDGERGGPPVRPLPGRPDHRLAGDKVGNGEDPPSDVAIVSYGHSAYCGRSSRGTAFECGQHCAGDLGPGHAREGEQIYLRGSFEAGGLMSPRSPPCRRCAAPHLLPEHAERPGRRVLRHAQ